MTIQDDSKKDKGPTVKDILDKLAALGYTTTVFGAGGSGGDATQIPYGPKASAEGAGFPPRHGSVIGAAGLDQVQPRANYEAIKGWAPVPPGKPAEFAQQAPASLITGPHGVPVQSAFGRVYVIPRQCLDVLNMANGGPGVEGGVEILFVQSTRTITLLMDIIPMKRWSFDNELLHAGIPHIILDPEAGAELTFAWEV